MADSRYIPVYPVAGRRSPTYNPARLSMPTVPSVASAPGQYSLYSGPIPLMPPSSHQHQHQHPHPHQHQHQHQQHYDGSSRRQTNPLATTTYQAAHDPVTRSSSVRQTGNTPSNRTHRSSTMDSNTTRPIIVTTSGSSRPHAAVSSHSSGQSGERSPTRDAFRSSDEQYYSQPASSIRSRSAHRPTYSATLDNDEIARLRERGDPRLLEPYRPRGSGGPVYHSSAPPRPVGPSTSASSKEHKRAAVPDEGFEYYRPSDLLRYDLENPRPVAGSSRRRRESVDRGSYYRPSVVVNSGYDRSRPPPTMRGLEKMNRSSAAYDGSSVRMPVPAVPPAVPIAPLPDTARRSASESKSLNPPARRERPSSMYLDERPYHHQDNFYYPPREEDHHHHERRNVDQEYDSRYDAGDGFRDDSVPLRGFGIRTDDEYDPAASYRRPINDYVEMPLLPEARRRSDESLDFRDERDREERVREDRAHRERIRAREEEDDQRRPSAKGEERGLKQKVAAGIGAAVSAVSLDAAVKGEKSDKEAKEEAPQRARSPNDEPQRDRREESPSRDWSRSRSRERSTEPAKEHSRDRDGRRDRHARYEEREEERKERNRHAAEDKLNGASSSSSGQLTPTSDDERQASEIDKRRSRKSFKPNDPADLMDIKAQLDELDKKGAGKDVDSRKTTASPEKRVVDVHKSVAEEDNRGRELVPTSSEKEKQVRVVSPPREKGAPAKPIKGILKPPSEKFPEDPNPIREGVAPHKDDKTKKDTPVGARWTKIRRDIVNPEALSAGKERYEVRDNSVIVLRVLSREEIERYAYATQLIREQRHEQRLRKERLGREHDRGYSKDRDYEKGHPREREEDDKDRRHHKAQRRDDEDEERIYREPRERDWDRDRERGERRKSRYEKDVDSYDEGQRSIEYHGGHNSSNYHRSHKDRDD